MHKFYLLQNTRTLTQLSQVHCHFITRIVFSPLANMFLTLSETPTEWPLPSIFTPTCYSWLFMYSLKRWKLSFQLSFFLPESSPEDFFLPESSPELPFMAILTFSSMYLKTLSPSTHDPVQSCFCIFRYLLQETPVLVPNSYLSLLVLL